MKSISIVELQKPSIYTSDLIPPLTTYNFLRMQLLDGSHRELTNPELGRDFISGVLENGRALGYFRRSFIRSLEFSLVEDETLVLLTYTRKTVGELLQTLDFPLQLSFRYREESASFQRARILGVTRGFMVTDYYLNPAIPLAAISAIEAGCE